MVQQIWIHSLLIALHCVFLLLCAIPLFLHFKREIQWIFVCIGNIRKHKYSFITCIFETLYGWYTLWKELQQLQPDDLLVQTSPPHEEFITEVREQLIQPPFVEPVTSFQDLRQDFQVSNIEYSLDLHIPNISLERSIPHQLFIMTEHLQSLSMEKKDV